MKRLIALLGFCSLTAAVSLSAQPITFTVTNNNNGCGWDLRAGLHDPSGQRCGHLETVFATNCTGATCVLTFVTDYTNCPNCEVYLFGAKETGTGGAYTTDVGTTGCSNPGSSSGTCAGSIPFSVSLDSGTTGSVN